MYNEWKYTQLRHQEMLRQAQQMRLANAVTRRQNRVVRFLLAKAGTGLVIIGKALRERYAPAPVPVNPPLPAPVISRNMAAWYVGDNRCEREESNLANGGNRLFKSSPPRHHPTKS